MADTAIPEASGIRGSRVWFERHRLRVAIALAVVMVLAVGATLLVRREGSTSTSVLLDRALAAHVGGRLDQADALYRQILVRDPADKLANYNLGLIAQTKGQAVDAERSYRRALASDPAYGPALFNLAVLKYAAGDDAAAVALYRQVISVDQTNGAAHLNLGYALRHAGQVQAGNEEISLAIQLVPDLAAQAPKDVTTTSTTAAK